MDTLTQQTESIKVPETAGMSHAALQTADLNKIIADLANQDAKINIILENSERMSRASVRSMWITIIFFVLPLILSVVAGVLVFKSLQSSGIGLADFSAYANIGNIVEELKSAKGTPNEVPTQVATSTTSEVQQ